MCVSRFFTLRQKPAIPGRFLRTTTVAYPFKGSGRQSTHNLAANPGEAEWHQEVKLAGMSEDFLQRPGARLPDLKGEADALDTSPGALQDRLKRAFARINTPDDSGEIQRERPAPDQRAVQTERAAPEPSEFLEEQRQRRQHAPMLPADPLELPALRQDSAYAVVTTQALNARGERAMYRVPEGYRGLLLSEDGSGGTMLLPGEEAVGDFVLHLFRAGTHEVEQRLDGLTSQDGFQLSAALSIGLRLPTSDRDLLRTFVNDYAEGRSHMSLPLIKQRLERIARETMQAHTLKHSAESLLENPRREEAEAAFLEAVEERGLSAGLKVLGLDALNLTSRDFTEARKKQARQRRAGEEEVQKKQIEAVIMREEAGAELSRAELREVLQSVRREGQLKEIEHERERLQRESALTQLESEYRKEKHNLEATLRKLLAANELEIDRIKFDEYLRMTQEVRERLEEDRIEFYISQIKDERLKSELLKRLIERDMTPDQLRELAELERARVELARSSTRMPALSAEREDSDEEVTTAPSAPLVSAPAETSTSSQASPTGSESLTNLRKRFQTFAERRATSERMTSTSQANAPFQSEALPPAPPEIEDDPDDSVFLVPTPVRLVDAPPAISGPEAQGESRWSSSIATQTTASAEASGLDELGSMLVVAGRGIYESRLHSSGRATEAMPWLNMDDQSLGSLRSIQSESLNGSPVLLIGARRGVYIVDRASKRISNYPLQSAFNPLTGVNAVAIIGGKIYGTHSQFGLLRWSIPGVQVPADSFLTNYTESARSVRSIFIDEGRWPTFACGRRVLALEHDVHPHVVAEYSDAPSDILLVHSYGDRFVAACQNGEIVCWEKSRPDWCRELMRLPEDISACTVSADGRSLVIGTRGPSVRVYSLDQNVIARYDAPQDMRMAREFGRHLFGVSRDRSTLYLWESYGDGHPVTEVPLPDSAFDVVGM